MNRASPTPRNVLDAEYFKEVVHLRPAQEPLTLYFRASLFAGQFPDRKPEFQPSAHPLQDPPTAPPAEDAVDPATEPQ